MQVGLSDCFYIRHLMLLMGVKRNSIFSFDSARIEAN